LLTVFLARTRGRAEKWVLYGGYAGGLLALFGLLADILEKRFV